MNKKIWIWLAILVLGIGAVIGLSISLTKQKDQVEIIEEFSYGEKSVLEGLTLWTRMRYGLQKGWEITHAMGENGETVVRPYDWEESDLISSKERVEYQLVTSTYGGVHYTEYTEEGNFQRIFGLEDMVADVASRTTAGNTHQETLAYQDYMDYYPMDMSCFIGDIYSKEGNEYVKMSYDRSKTPAFYEELQRFFQIPVSEESHVTISVTKDQDGKIVAEEMERDDNTPIIWISYLKTDTGWYFGFSESTKSIDTSHIPGGNGVYFMPLEEENGYPCLRPEKLSIVISLEEGDRVRGLYTDESQETLFVLVWNDGHMWLHIYDRATMTEIQVIDMDDVGGKVASVYVYPHDDFLLVDSNLYWLFERNGAGIYELKFRVAEEIIHDHRLLGKPNGVSLKDAVIRYKGEQLLIAGWRFAETDASAQKKDGFYLSVYDETGLIYYGLYKTSLDTGRSDTDELYACEPDGYYNFDMDWK